MSVCAKSLPPDRQRAGHVFKRFVLLSMSISCRKKLDLRGDRSLPAPNCSRSVYAESQTPKGACNLYTIRSRSSMSEEDSVNRYTTSNMKHSLKPPLPETFISGTAKWSVRDPFETSLCIHYPTSNVIHCRSYVIPDFSDHSHPFYYTTSMCWTVESAQDTPSPRPPCTLLRPARQVRPRVVQSGWAALMV